MKAACMAVPRTAPLLPARTMLHNIKARPITMSIIQSLTSEAFTSQPPPSGDSTEPIASTSTLPADLDPTQPSLRMRAADKWVKPNGPPVGVTFGARHLQNEDDVFNHNAWYVLRHSLLEDLELLSVTS